MAARRAVRACAATCLGVLLLALMAWAASPARAATVEHRFAPTSVDARTIGFRVTLRAADVRAARLRTGAGTRRVPLGALRRALRRGPQVALRRPEALRGASARRMRASVRLELSARGVTGGTARDRDDAARDRLGVNSLLLWDDQAAAELRTLAAAGVRWVRADFSWAELEPAEGHFRWTNSDRLMAGAAQAGVDVLAIAAYSAPWASSDPTGNGDVHYPPTDAADYGRFVAALLDRYGAGGAFWRSRPDLEPRPLRAVEIWNEPHGHWFWKPEPSVSGYARLVRATLDATRERAADTTFLAGGDVLEYRTTGQQPWLERLLAAAPDLAREIDAWSVHPYSDPPGGAPWAAVADRRYAFAGRVELAHATLRAAGSSARLWATEFGWCVGGGPCGGVTEAQQATYTEAAVGRLLGDWRDVVEKSFVFTWNRTSNTSTDWTERFGLRRPDGTTRPAWDAFAKRLGRPMHSRSG